jgi:hypothetical protein
MTIVQVNHGNGSSPCFYLTKDYGKPGECGLVFSAGSRGRRIGGSPSKFHHSVGIALINGRYESQPRRSEREDGGVHLPSDRSTR